MDVIEEEVLRVVELLGLVDDVILTLVQQFGKDIGQEIGQSLLKDASGLTTLGSDIKFNKL